MKRMLKTSVTHWGCGEDSNAVLTPTQCAGMSKKVSFATAVEQGLEPWTSTHSLVSRNTHRWGCLRDLLEGSTVRF